MFLKTLGPLVLTGAGCARTRPSPAPVLVNDVHSRLNPTYVQKVVKVDGLPSLRRGIEHGADCGKAVSVCGGRHAMGGQQFLSEGILLDTTRMNRVLDFDAHRGLLEVEAGIQWPGLLRFLLARQRGKPRVWTFAQKQTGANNFCLGGAVASNIHSRGLAMKPFIADIESLKLVDSQGALTECNRNENAELFRLLIGGYGLFGVVYSVKLRLVPRRKVQRSVELLKVENLMRAFEQRIADGFLYGDFQFAIDPQSEDFLKQGVFSCYRPVPLDTPETPRRPLSSEQWKELLYGAHTAPAAAFARYAEYYQTTSGNIYWSDLHQFSRYLPNYHDDIDRRMTSATPGSEMITEIYVPRRRLCDFLDEAREDFRKHRVSVIYGTIRLIERDDESFLAWARQPFACVIFNLHTAHSPASIQRSAEAFRRLIDSAIRYGGSYYLTYHRYATRQQLETCYPQFSQFLVQKQKFDPDQRFQSDWYRNYVRSQ